MAQVWYAKRGDLEFGPWSGQQLRQAAASGLLRLDDLVRPAEKDKWLRAGDVKGLAFGAAPVQPEPIQEPNSSQSTSPERRQPPPLPTNSRPGPPPLPTPPRLPLRFPVNVPKRVLLGGVGVLGLLVVCGVGVLTITGGKLSPALVSSSGLPAATIKHDPCTQVIMPDLPPDRVIVYDGTGSPEPAVPGLGRKLLGHTENVVAVAASPDGRRLVSTDGAHNKTLKLWDLASVKELVSRQFSDSVNSAEIRFFPDGKLLLLYHRRIDILSAETLEPVGELDRTGTGGYYGFSISNDGRWVAAVG